MEPSHFRITRVVLRQFRSLAEADVSLGDLVFLVGPNGAGKSNFLDALRLVSQGVGSSLHDALHERGGAAQVRRRAPGRQDRFSVRLEFEGPDLAGTYEVQVAVARGGGFRVAGEHCAVESGGRRASYRVEDGALAVSTERRLPAADPQGLLLAQLGRHAAFRAAHAGLAGMSVFDPDPRAMRVVRPAQDGRALLHDGSNAAAVLYRLGRAASAEEHRRLESYLRQIVPGLTSVRRRVTGGAETLEFGQAVAGAPRPSRFAAGSVSDGTLRALGVLLALFAPAAGGQGVVAVEEPQSALHPAVVAVLRQALRDASDRRQVLVTSHSPELLEDEEIPVSQVRAVRSVEGVTTVDELDEPAAFTLRAGLGTAGALLREGRLVPRPSAAGAAGAEDSVRSAGDL
ncbi:AAA family ATPase [Actinacidiphila acididurans]|uniref:AAA family ATPase n=1 Tax=Actinacidiphila acididurans TaxID=2784346 RepID=A0ABS2TU02_9ACTN|nr:AAA family ATPase [Actinacidiphila acididurans]MBM9506823.1 AAA family ATPase [Actinacidiphila acididurans]